MLASVNTHMLAPKKVNRMLVRKKSKEAKVLAKTKLSPSSSTFPKRRSQGNQEQIQLNIDEKEEQVGQGVSQDVVVSLLKNISRKTFVRKPKNSNRMMMRRKSK